MRSPVPAGVVTRRRYNDHPPRYAYRLTSRGRALGTVLDALADWGVEHLPGTRRLGRS
jgi:DNA-binding HxlR family transcriptional regulator